MLTPEYLQEIEFNKVVDLYEKLNISITADIIERVSQMQEVTNTTKEQLRILIQSNGTEIFERALEEASMLRTETKNELRIMFEQMIKEDMEGYKKLYEYRDKTFKLSDTQSKILNQGFKQTNDTLKNFTNTIAFSSKQAYVQAVDEAYYKVATGAFDYATAISQTAQKLADKGITLKDKAGRNVQLETAIRRNIRWGLQETANKINRDIEDELGCDGYEVTAHVGARPTHAEEQGKQFALTKEDAGKYNVGLWSDVEDLWQEYNCRHSYSGIILGVSEPVYSDEELKDYKNATVNYNGKKIPYYEATQKQRALENQIRKTTRSAKTLEKAGLNSKEERTKLRQLNKDLNNFLKETGLNKDYSRIKVAVEKHKVIEQDYFIDSNGNKYKIDGKNVKIKADDKEREVAKLLSETYKKDVKLVPVVLNPKGIQTPDYMIGDSKYDLKQVSGNGKNTLDTAISKKKKQSNNFIFDISNTEMKEEEAMRQIEKIYTSKHREWVEEIMLIKDNEVLKIYKRQ